MTTPNFNYEQSRIAAMASQEAEVRNERALVLELLQKVLVKQDEVLALLKAKKPNKE